MLSRQRNVQPRSAVDDPMSDQEPPYRSGPSVPSSGAKPRKRARVRTAKGPASRPHLPETPTGEAPRDEPPEHTEPKGRPKIEQAGRWDRPGMVNAKLVYSAYLVSPALPIAALAAFGFAHYAKRRQPPAWLATHYTYQIRTFWGALAGYALTIALSFAGGGLIIYPLVAIWIVARSVHGIVRAAHGQPIDDPDAFII